MSATFKLALAALAITMAAPAAFAERPAKQPAARVSYGDIDVSAPAGGAKLLHRIEAGARRACRDAVDHSPLAERQRVECQHDAVEATVRQLNIETLTLAWNRSETAQVQLSAR
jgi:UrcA family protein